LISSALQINPNTKVFIVENLKEFTKNLLKVPSIIFSISKSLESTELNDFYEHLNVHNEWLRNYRRIQPNINHVIEKKKSKKIEIEPKITIIEKSQDKKPDINVENMKNDISSDFISFSNNSTSIYKPIKMRKVLGNPNRKTGKKRL
jgi:methyltransferase-like protein